MPRAVETAMVRAKAKVSVPVNAAATALVMETAMKAARAKVGVVETVKAVEKLAERRLDSTSLGSGSLEPSRALLCQVGRLGIVVSPAKSHG